MSALLSEASCARRMEACDAEARGTSTAPWPPVTAHLWPPPALPPALEGPLKRGTRGGAHASSSRPTAGTLLAPWAFVWPTHHQVPPARTFSQAGRVDGSDCREERGGGAQPGVTISAGKPACRLSEAPVFPASKSKQSWKQPAEISLQSDLLVLPSNMARFSFNART